MKTRPVMPLVIAMALPMTISMLVNALYNIVDSYFVAKISEDAMTALSLVYPVQNVLNAISVGFAIGINAVISYFMGAGNNETANKAASLGLMLNIIHGAVLTVICMLFMRKFLCMFTGNENIISMGSAYSNIVFLFAIPICVSVTFEKIFQSVGRMMVSMVSMIFGCVVNIILDPVLINIMGIKGAALATGIGQTVPVITYLSAYFIMKIPVKIHIKDMKPDASLIKRLYLIGIPASFNMALPSIQVSVLNKILSAVSDGYVLVLGAYYKLQTFLYLTANGVIQGMRPVIGYNYGAGEKKRVKKIFASALTLIAGVMVIGTILCLVIPDRLMEIFTHNESTIYIGKSALRIISAGFIVSSVAVTVSGALEGLSMGIQSFVISILRYVVIILPAAYLLTRTGNPANVWHCFWITEVLTAIVAVIIYRKNIGKIT